MERSDLPILSIMKIEERHRPHLYRELIQNRSKLFHFPRWVGYVFNQLSKLIEFPIIGHFLQRSFYLVSYSIGRYHRQGDYLKLYTLLTHSLQLPAFKTRPHHWWHLMRLAVAVTQERQIQWLVRDPYLEDHLILMGSLGPQPLRGYDVSYVFVGYALWLFERNNVIAAVHMVQIAERADESWGYPEYLHGWFGLFTQGVNSVEHFTKAVQTDWSFLQKMKHDRVCLNNPEILHEVQRRTLVRK